MTKHYKPPPEHDNTPHRMAEYSIDSLIEALQALRQVHGNLVVAMKDWDTDAHCPIKSIDVAKELQFEDWGKNKRTGRKVVSLSYI